MSAFRMLVGCLSVAITSVLLGAPLAGAIEGEAEFDKDKLRQEVHSSLRDTIWELELTEPGSGKKTTDTLTFEELTVSSENLTGKGFNTSNFSLMVQDEGVGVWQTMQVSEKEGSAFWRGELHTENKDKMFGMLSLKPTPDTSKEYAFRATKVSGPSDEEAAAIAAAKEAAEAEAKAARAVREAEAAVAAKVQAQVTEQTEAAEVAEIDADEAVNVFDAVSETAPAVEPAVRIPAAAPAQAPAPKKKGWLW